MPEETVENESENEAHAVTGRPNDIPIRDAEPAPLGGNTTFADRAKQRRQPAAKAVSSPPENKAIGRSRSKAK